MSAKPDAPVSGHGKPQGWPDRRCLSCGGHWSKITYDLVLGFCCGSCGKTDADE